MKDWKIKDPAGSSHPHSLPSLFPEAAVNVLLARGMETEQQLRYFLQPPHRLPYCPLRLDGMEAAVKRILPLAGAVTGRTQESRVGIVGDFDVDGITGTALLVEGLGELGLDTIPYLPHRVSEGHGLSSAAVEYMAEQGAGLVITVDCGVSSVQEVAEANKLGIDVIITDHHFPPTNAPSAAAIINPRMPGNEYPFPNLCGAGLAYKLVQGLFQVRGRATPPHLAELAALGTIADLVPLEDENRFLVKAGLKQLSQTERPGLRAMYRRAGLEGRPVTSEAVAFQLAPRLNAAGRMGHAEDSLKLLTTMCQQKAEVLAEKLEGQNRQRRILTREVVEDVLAQLDGAGDLPPLILAEHPGITPGIAGLVASHLAEEFQRPAVALAQIGQNRFTGSGRSVPAFNLIEALNTCSDLFLRHGGHAQAAGFVISQDSIPPLQARLNDVVAEAMSGSPEPAALPIDCELTLTEISPGLLRLLDQLEPYGMGNPKPLFLTRNLEIVEIRNVGSEGQHLKLLVSDGRRRLPALLFHRAEGWQGGSGPVDLVYSISSDYWRGKKRINLVVQDFRNSDRG